MKTEKTKELTPITAVDWFYNEVKELKPFLPKKHNEKILKALPPEYDSYNGTKQIQNVLAYRTTDMNVLKAIETVIKETVLTSEANGKL